MKFKSDKQRKAVMAKLKGGQKVHRTKKYNRYRIRDPDEFKKSSFRTLDIGKPKRHQLIRGKLKKTGEWATQAVIVEKGIKDGTTKEIIEKAKKYPKTSKQTFYIGRKVRISGAPRGAWWEKGTIVDIDKKHKLIKVKHPNDEIETYGFRQILK